MAGGAQRLGGLARLILIEAWQHRDQLRDSNAAARDGDFLATNHLINKGAEPVLGIEKRDIHVLIHLARWLDSQMARPLSST
jgi:hypothetical protein